MSLSLVSILILLSLCASCFSLDSSLSSSSSREGSQLLSSGMNPTDYLSAVHSSFSSLSSSSSPSSASSGQKSPTASGIFMLSEGKSSKDSKDDEEDGEETEFKLSSGDCRTTQDNARGRKRKTSKETYIPECTSDGKYKELQCYQNFCWCVDLDTGLPMKVSGSSADSSHPDCSQKKAINKRKDCPYEQKIQFLKLLTALFQREMISNKSKSHQQASLLRGRGRNNHRLPSSSSLSLVNNKRQVLNWKFGQIDKNHDQRINQTEWKSFRRSLRGVRRGRSKNNPTSSDVIYDESFTEVRHCFKLFFRGCDVNGDKLIVKHEWYECTGKNIDFDYEEEEMAISSSGMLLSSVQSASLSARHRRRRGPNPFQTILKAD